MFEPVSWPMAQVMRFIRTAIQDLGNLSAMSVVLHRTGIPSSWSSPPLSWTKINIDGSFIPASSLCASGGVARDAAGTWLFGFMSRHGHGDPLMAELAAIRQGLSLCWQRGIRKIQCESDCVQAIHVLNSSGIGGNPMYRSELAACCLPLAPSP